MVALVMIAYLPLHSAAFINFDDPEYVLRNPHVNTGVSLRNVSWAFARSHSANWHPLTWISHMIDCQVYGLRPGGHHLTSIIMHIVNSLLLLWLLRAMTGTFWRSAAVALLFALHPLHVESVAWISERKDVLSTLFMLAATVAYVNYCRSARAVALCGSLVLYACALMSKPMPVTLPVLLLLLDYWPLRRITGWTGCGEFPRKKPGRLIAEKVPFFILAFASGLLTIWAQNHDAAIKSIDLIPITVRLATAVISYGVYVFQMFWPVKLAVFYPYPHPILVEHVIAAAVFVAAMTTAAFLLARKAAWFSAGWFWYIISLLPVIGLVQVGLQARADRYTYVPFIGLFIIVVWGGYAITARIRWNAWIRGIAGVLVIAALTLCTRKQTGYWHDSIGLFSQTLQVTGDNVMAHNIVGVSLNAQGDYDLAAAHFASVLQKHPANRIALINLGCAFDEKGMSERAIPLFRAVLSQHPRDADALADLGIAFLHLGRLDSATFYSRATLEADPSRAGAEYNLGLSLHAQNQRDSALVHYRRALRKDPEYWQAAMNEGLTLREMGNFQDAVDAFSRVLAIVPDNLKALYLRGESFDTLGEHETARKDFGRALRLDPGFTPARERLNAK